MLQRKPSTLLLEQLGLVRPEIVDEFLGWLQRPEYGQFIFHANNNRVVFAEIRRTIKSKEGDQFT